ncbi:MAG: hypothetical protein UIB63_09250 [Methanobrevibacter sp.]|uniref:hypothetical protein n=1 Tax=Methanobrevibacter sp. TaxID=66852 RepID=UPI002E7A94B6|nr:hypothetical protein [Methanobrevibacter sp.]MEE0943283.1 hypothetical protein [Methanobrevibacter sp.]
MREIKVDPNWHFPKTRKTDFTKEEMLDIIDFYLQYKPMLENQDSFNPHDFTMLLYMYKMVDVDYINNMTRIKKKYGKQYVEDLSKERLDFLEIITIFTFIHRAERHAGGGWYDECIADGTYYNLLCRLEEIKNELKSE